MLAGGRGQDWYCGVCGPWREPCVSYGTTPAVHSRDRHGRPRCGQCPSDDGRDPLGMIVDVVSGIDPTLPREVVATAARAAATQAGQRNQLAGA